MAKIRKMGSRLRIGVQIGFFVLVALIVTGKALVEQGVAIPLAGGASLHAVCPFGGVVSFYQFVTSGTLVKKIHDSSLILSGLVLVLLVLFGPVFCGWACPFGSFQEWIGKIGRRIFKKRYNAFVPHKLDRILRYLRYLVLIWVSYMTIVTGKLFFQDIDPYFALFQFWTGEVAISGFLVLGITVLASLFVERPFCKYACPYGAFQGIFNLFRVFGIKRRVATCIDCKACDRACPMNIIVSESGTVRDHQCISCMACTSEAACPVAETVSLSAGNVSASAKGTAPRAWKQIKSLPLAATVIVVIFGGIFLTMALNLWRTESTKEPVRFNEGEYAGLPNPGDIRGSYTWTDIERAFGIPAAEIAAAFSLGAERLPVEGRVGDLETIYEGLVTGDSEIGTDSVRLFVSLVLSLPYEPEAGTVLPPKAVEYLEAAGALAGKDAGPWTAEIEHNAQGPASLENRTVPSEDHEQADRTITGRTTIADLYDWGLTGEEMAGVLGFVPKKGPQTVRDAVEAEGGSFSSAKTGLQGLLDAGGE